MTEESPGAIRCAAAAAVAPLKLGLGLGRAGRATELDDDIDSLVEATE
jgi:hypothetical protein